MQRLLCFVMILLGVGPTSSGPASRDTEWRAVREAIDQKLPRTAVAALKPIIGEAIQEKAYDEATRALALRIGLESQIEGGKSEEKIVRLRGEIENRPAEMKPLLEVILAHAYWGYFNENRWRIHERTPAVATPGVDLRSWDLERILAEVDNHFSAALSHEKWLKGTLVSEWDGVLVEGDLPDKYRPTMFDFIAHEALQFYVMGEQGVVAPEDGFELEAGGPIFAPVDSFLAWNADTTDESSLLLKAMRLFQQLLVFHGEDADKTAFLDVDLERLRLGHNVAVGENRDSLYVAALKRFTERWSRHELSARALAEWAGVLRQQGDFVEAHRLAERGWREFPESPGGAHCFNIIQGIEAKKVSLQTELVWNAPLPDIQVTYRNIEKLYLRAVLEDFRGRLASGMTSPYDHGEASELVRRSPALEWSTDLPPTPDFRERTEMVAVPKGLQHGFYFVLASHDSSFGKDANVVSVSPVWVSDLALVVRERHFDGTVEGYVLEALLGDPLEGATVESWRAERNGGLRLDTLVTTDQSGRFQISVDPRQSVRLLARHREDQLASLRASWAGRGGLEPAGARTVFFTDRALYRPGQTIRYKGIRFHYNQNTNDYRALVGHDITVTLQDTHGREIDRATHHCNDYGGFSGQFTAPRGGLLGQMTIHGPDGWTAIHVEEYKRPKFRVELSSPSEAPRLEGEVAVPGKATAYTGAAIGGAKVRWRVVRKMRFPVWCWWRSHLAGRRTQIVAHGTELTDEDGTFMVRFVARPDRSVPAQEEPTFEYEVHATVTDFTGESRRDEHLVRIGYTAMSATLTADPWQVAGKPVKLSIQTQSLDGEPLSARGTIQIYELAQPEKVVRPSLTSPSHWSPGPLPEDGEPAPDPSNPNTWALGDRVHEEMFATGDSGRSEVTVHLEVGIYRVVLNTQDRYDQAVHARLQIQVVDPDAKHLSAKIANLLVAPKWELEPGEVFVALWGTGYESGRALVEMEVRGKSLRRFWTARNRTQEMIQIPVTERMRGGFTLRVTFVRENRVYVEQHLVRVPWSNKNLTVKWGRFRSNLVPGEKETWTVTITGPDSEAAVAEMVAALYDASLDLFMPHSWMRRLNAFRMERNRTRVTFANQVRYFNRLHGSWPTKSMSIKRGYRTFPRELAEELGLHSLLKQTRMLAFEEVQEAVALNAGVVVQGGELHVRGGRAPGLVQSVTVTGEARPAEIPPPPPPMGLPPSLGMQIEPDREIGESGLELNKVTARRNLQETAFFFPHLRSDSSGVVSLQFTMPEALTEWRFLGFAHDRDLRHGLLGDRAVTAKELMVLPNPPRFVREGDIIEFVVKVSNQSTEPQKGKVRLAMADARTLEPMDEALGNRNPELRFEIAAGQSRSYSWRLSVPDGCAYLTYKVAGASTEFSDGEEGFLPVLSRHVLVTESLPLPIRGRQTKRFAFDKLLHSAESSTLRHQSLTLQMVSQPAWYAVMALPYLIEYPYECSEQIFNRLYANSLARHIVDSDPKIRHVFELWKGTPALDSPLEKNQDLVSLMLEETPWLRQAEAESQARRNVGLLFDANRLAGETEVALQRLRDLRNADGLYPWFSGGRSNPYISLYITTGFGRLRHLGVDMDASAAAGCILALDAWMAERYLDVLKRSRAEDNHLSPLVALYLYGRSFFLDRPVAANHEPALDYWRGQARKYWPELSSRQSQAHVALGLHRFGDREVPRAIMNSLEERSLRSPELGMFWRDAEVSWWWHRAPIETQAMMIEAFDEVMHDSVAVEDCRVWLLKQKQTQDWKTTKATADAIYALLLRGTSILASDVLVEVALGGERIVPENVEAGTGFYEHRFTHGEIRPRMGAMEVKKLDDGVSWGSLHWQYLETLDNVTSHAGTALKLDKSLYTKETTKKGQVLRTVGDSLMVGDELIVRIELRADRDMEYVHLWDQRGSGTEPVDVLSRYEYQDGLAYYQSTRDAATHFFIDNLPKGVYVLEYSARIQHRGIYQSGFATVQCMYAPEFNSHSGSFTLNVK